MGELGFELGSFLLKLRRMKRPLPRSPSMRNGMDDGHYDGINKAFRGFGHVTRALVGSESRESGEQRLTYDLAIDDAYRNGLLLEAEGYGGEGDDLRHRAR